MVNEYEPSKIGVAIANESRDIQKEIVEMIIKVTSLKVGIGESICKNKISLHESNYLKLTDKSMDIINNFLDPVDLIDDLYGPKVSLIQRALIVSGFLHMKPTINEIIDFNFTLLIHLQSILESKRRVADQKISIIISFLALLVAIIIAVYRA